ncbi:hypothetical protein [Nocardia shimofusensis]|uniref:hypothetical protein n=1 Tax=Nocardia shimofusensis TaxID=228596 RepID=UPI000A037541|nr:hypothetical protein [Nocardia shimofusensis]
MAQTAAARAELDRRGGELHERIAELVALCTPDALAAMPALGEPEVADWQQPPRYRHSLTVRGSRDPAVSPETLAAQVTAALTAAKWQVAAANTQNSAANRDESAGGLVVDGSSEGSQLRVRFSTTSTVVLYTGETPAIALTTPEPDRRPPARSADTVDPGHVLCYECAGTGWCPVCEGRGWIADERLGRRRCPECFDRRVCPICEGAGELAVARLSPVQRANYAHLPDGSK